jgi:hypothetical protein
MDEQRLADITRIVQQRFPEATIDLVSDYCAGPWEDSADRHFRWLETAPIEEVAHWVEAGYPWIEEAS